MKKTYQELIEIDGIIARLYAEDLNIRKGKFGYAYTKFHTKNIAPVQKEMREKLEDLQVDNALTDEKTGELLYGEPAPNQQKGDFKFNKEGMKKLTFETRALIKEFQEKEIEIEPFFSSVIPAGLSVEDIDALRGCVIGEYKKSEEAPKKKKNA
jgi:hypothetical protein